VTATCCQFRFIDMYNSHSIVSSQYQYIYRATDEVAQNGAVDNYPYGMDEEQLYDLEADPYQLVNLVDSESHWSVLTQFQHLMRGYLEDVCPADDPTECVKPDLSHPDGEPNDDPTPRPTEPPSPTPSPTRPSSSSGSRSGSTSRRSGSSSRGSKSSSSTRSSSGRRSGSGSRSGSMDEMEIVDPANERRNRDNHEGREEEEMELMVVDTDTVEGEESWSSHLDTALVLQLTGIITLIYAAYQLYARCVMEKVAKEMITDQETAYYQKSRYAMVNGQVVY